MIFPRGALHRRKRRTVLLTLVQPLPGQLGSFDPIRLVGTRSMQLSVVEELDGFCQMSCSLGGPTHALMLHAGRLTTTVEGNIIQCCPRRFLYVFVPLILEWMPSLLPQHCSTDTTFSLGFSAGRGGTHLARTMMLDELSLLLDCVSRLEADSGEYVRVIEQGNCLGKRSGRTRKLTVQHLTRLYALDPSVTLFRALRHYWSRDESGRPLIALLCAYARDAVLRLSAPFILSLPEGTVLEREALEAFIEQVEPGRFSKATLKSTAQNINGTWTRSGHLSGRVCKTRVRVNATPGAASYALLLGYLRGIRGQALFHTEYTRILDCPGERVAELAEEASRRGWLVYKRVGDVMEVLFPSILNPQEVERIREQN